MIRFALACDVDRLVEMFGKLHAESHYSNLPLSNEKLRAFFAGLIDDGFLMVSQRDGKIIGMMAGAIHEHYFTDALFASDYVLYVEPAFRGGMTAARLLDSFTAWAIKAGADVVTVGTTTGINADQTGRFFEGMGFEKIGGLYQLGKQQCVIQ